MVGAACRMLLHPVQPARKIPGAEHTKPSCAHGSQLTGGAIRAAVHKSMHLHSASAAVSVSKESGSAQLGCRQTQKNSPVRGGPQCSSRAHIAILASLIRPHVYNGGAASGRRQGGVGCWAGTQAMSVLALGIAAAAAVVAAAIAAMLHTSTHPCFESRLRQGGIAAMPAAGTACVRRSLKPNPPLV